MVQIVEPGSIKAAYHVHDVVEDDGLVEGALLGRRPSCFHCRPLAVLHLVAEQVVEALLIRVNATEDEDSLVHDDC